MTSLIPVSAASASAASHSSGDARDAVQVLQECCQIRPQEVSSAVRALAQLCSAHEHWGAGVGTEAIGALVGVLHTRPGVPVAVQACRGLSLLCRGVAAHQTAALEAGSCVALAACLSAHSGSPEAVRAACQAIEHLCTGRGAAARRALLGEGGLLLLLIGAVEAAALDDSSAAPSAVSSAARTALK